MRGDHNTEIVDELCDLLDRERRCLLAGDMETLLRLTDAKSEIANRLRGMSNIPKPDFKELDQRFRRNQALFLGAADGIRTVIERMGELKRARTSMRTYDSSGRAQQNKTASPAQLEHRA